MDQLGNSAQRPLWRAYQQNPAAVAKWLNAVSRTAQMRFAKVEGRVNAEVFIEFLRRLIHNRRKPVYLIVDGPPSRKATMVSKYVESVAERLRPVRSSAVLPRAEPGRAGQERFEES